MSRSVHRHDNIDYDMAAQIGLTRQEGDQCKCPSEAINSIVNYSRRCWIRALIDQYIIQDDSPRCLQLHPPSGEVAGKAPGGNFGMVDDLAAQHRGKRSSRYATFLS